MRNLSLICTTGSPWAVRVSRAIRAQASAHSAKYAQQVRNRTIRGMALPRQVLLPLCWGLRECLTPSFNCSKKNPRRGYRATGCRFGAPGRTHRPQHRQAKGLAWPMAPSVCHLTSGLVREDGYRVGGFLTVICPTHTHQHSKR